MRFIDRFFAMIDSHIDAAVVRVIARDKCMLAEQVAESYRHMIDPQLVADHMDFCAIAERMSAASVAHHIDEDSLADLVADRVDIDHSDIATRLARNLDMDDVVSSVVDHISGDIDMSQVCDRCAEKIEVDEDDVAERAVERIAENIDEDEVARMVAEHIDMDTSEVAEKVAEHLDIDTDEIIEKAVEQIVDEIDNDSVAEQVAERIAGDADGIDYDRLAHALLRVIAKTAVL